MQKYINKHIFLNLSLILTKIVFRVYTHLKCLANSFDFWNRLCQCCFRKLEQWHVTKGLHLLMKKDEVVRKKLEQLFIDSETTCLIIVSSPLFAVSKFKNNNYMTSCVASVALC